MSYLDQLLVHTGIQIAPATVPVSGTIAPLETETEVVQPAPLSAADERPVLGRRVEAELTVSTPTVGDRVGPVEVQRPGPSAPSHVAETVAPDAAPPITREPAHPEIVIEERIVERSVAAADSEPRGRTGEVGDTQPHDVRVERTSAPRANGRERPETNEPPRRGPAAYQPTLIEVRRWVAATPAPEESSATTVPPDAGEAIPEGPPVVEPAGREGARGGAITKRRIDPVAPRIDLSIGTVLVTVEAPPPALQPAPPPPANPSVDASTTWSRLARRYVRI